MEHNTFKDLLKQESSVEKKTNKESPEIGWYKQIFEELQKIISVIPDKRRQNELPENPSINYLIMIATLKINFYSSSVFHLIRKGYYGPGMNLLRAIQEEYQHMLFFYYHPQNQIKQWNTGKIKSRKIQKYMSTSNYIPKKWKGIAKHHFRLHETLSYFVHPSRLGWRSVVQVDRDTGSNLLKFLPVYEKNSFNTAFIALISMIENTTLLLLEIFENELKSLGLYEDIMTKLKQVESEYVWPTLQNMRLDVGEEIIGCARAQP